MKPGGNLRFKTLIFILAISILSSCKPASRANEKPAQKTDANRTCVPEKELLSGNIMGGELVGGTDNDAQTVALLISGGQLCTAAPIGKKVLLTAAHCIDTSGKDSRVAFFSSVSCESGFNKNQHLKGVAKTIVHPEFNASSSPEEMKGDIALVILEENIPDNYLIYEIAEPQEVTASTDMFLYGYGRTGSNDGGAGMLRRASIARDQYEIVANQGKIKINQSVGVGICQGDSGGPALVNVSGKLKVLGVNSYVVGPENDICSKYSYQTLVSPYKSWILYNFPVE